jgi:hypothetical protein
VIATDSGTIARVQGVGFSSQKTRVVTVVSLKNPSTGNQLIFLSIYPQFHTHITGWQIFFAPLVYRYMPFWRFGTLALMFSFSFGNYTLT